MISELEGQHFIGRSFSHDDGVQLVSIHDENGMWVLDCFESGSEEILKRINGYEQLEQRLHESMQELSELVTKREMVRRLEQTNRQLFEALEMTDAMLNKGIFNCTSEEICEAGERRRQAITNAEQQLVK